MTRPAAHGVIGALVVAMLAATALASAERARRTLAQARPPAPALAALAPPPARPHAATRSRPQPSYEIVTLKVRRGLAMRATPGGRAIGWLDSQTQFRSRRSVA